MQQDEIRDAIPPYVTLSLSDLVGCRSDLWNHYFPFNSSNGLWTFSGRVALKEGLSRLALPAGSKILVPSYYQGSEISTLIDAKYTLEFYRLSRTLQVDLNDIEERITPDVRALYLIHYFGLPQDIGTIAAFCRDRGLALIEDCALSLLSRCGETWLGSSGDIALFSIYKSLPMPHGGYLVSKQPGPKGNLRTPPLRSTLAQSANLLAQRYLRGDKTGALMKLWSATRPWRRAVVNETVLSGQTKWSSVQFEYTTSAIARRLLKSFDPELVIARRRANFNKLHSLLAEFTEPLIQSLPDGACPLFYPILVSDKKSFRDALSARGIGSVNIWSTHHPACPPHLAKEVDYLRNHLVELPIHQQLNEYDMERIAAAVTSILMDEWEKQTPLQAAS
ncbi:MAG: DegT/DnrJ/EryC1/StrS aminotransferase family protein [Deltaproteobacteria bacterium]|nr:DegT/DnrJ/EryC1/StrS aminotransferase family protein [Deltaproteobacteria bacterium]